MIRAAAAAAFVAGAAVPAAAITYDANAAFTATSATSGAFTFGSYSGGVFTAYPTGGTCLFPGTTCLTPGNYLGVYQSDDGTAKASGTAIIPASGLVLHPGSADELSVILFTAPTTGYYTLTESAYQADVNAHTQTFGVLNSNTPFVLATLSTASPTFAVTGKMLLTAGQQIGVFVGNDGSYFNDATGVGFSATIPEPASWALMIVGFAMTGFAARRRTGTVVA